MTIRVEFEFEPPEEASDEEIIQWIRFELVGGSMSADNPLCEHDLEADW